MVKNGGTLRTNFSTRGISSRPVPTPYVRRTDRIFPTPATKQVKPASVPEQKIPDPPKLDVGKPTKAARVPALKLAGAKMNMKGFK